MTVINIILVVVLYNAYICGSKQTGPRTFTTRHGSLIGMIIPFRNTHPVEVISGFEYATAKSTLMRFIPPDGSLGKWIGRRVFSNRSNLGVCKQQFDKAKNKSVSNSVQYFDRLRRIEPYIIRQDEECLALNLFVPMIGKLWFVLNLFVAMIGKSRFVLNLLVSMIGMFLT